MLLGFFLVAEMVTTSMGIWHMVPMLEFDATCFAHPPVKVVCYYLCVIPPDYLSLFFHGPHRVMLFSIATASTQLVLLALTLNKYTTRGARTPLSSIVMRDGTIVVGAIASGKPFPHSAGSPPIYIISHRLTVVEQSCWLWLQLILFSKRRTCLL